jgi:hypothetical protein
MPSNTLKLSPTLVSSGKPGEVIMVPILTQNNLLIGIDREDGLGKFHPLN